MCTSEAEFCGDPFDENNVDESQKRWAYIDCAPPPPNQFDRRTVCKKVIQKGKCIHQSLTNDFIIAKRDDLIALSNVAFDERGKKVLNNLR